MMIKYTKLNAYMRINTHMPSRGHGIDSRGYVATASGFSSRRLYPSFGSARPERYLSAVLGMALN